MLNTYEAILEPNGRLHFVEAIPPPLLESHCVLVTFTKTAPEPVRLSHDWRQLSGILKHSPHLNGDPLTRQQEMRHDWD